MDGASTTRHWLRERTTFDLTRRLAAEAVGTASLLAVVVGSGIMGERLSDGDVAMALLANSLATGAGLVVLITIFAPVSGAHFNPAVTMAIAINDRMSLAVCAGYISAQLGGAIVGVWSAHLMFGTSILEVSQNVRSGLGQAFSEYVAAFGLVCVVLASARWKTGNAPMLVGLYIAAAYWFTASTSFANPAVTIARAMTDSFAGIAPGSVPAFIAAQLLGALCAVGFCNWLFGKPAP